MRDRGAFNDDLVIPEDAEMHFRESVDTNIDSVFLSSHDRNMKHSLRTNSRERQVEYGSGSVRSADLTTPPIHSKSSNTSTDSTYQPIALAETRNRDLLFQSTTKKKSLTALPPKEEPPKEEEIATPKKPSYDLSLDLDVEQPEKDEEEKEEIVYKEEEEKKEEVTVIKTCTIDIKNSLDQFEEQLRDRLQVQLPIVQLNNVAAQGRVAVKVMEEDLCGIESTMKSTEQKMTELDRKVRMLSGKSMALSQTTEVVSSKLKVLDDWVEGLDRAGGGTKLQILEWGIKFFSYIFSVLLLIYANLTKMKNIFKRKKD